jgi:hypothetical protein
MKYPVGECYSVLPRLPRFLKLGSTRQTAPGITCVCLAFSLEAT